MLSVFTTPPSDWKDAVDSHQAVFADGYWLNVLEDGLGTRSLFAWDAERSDGFPVSVFARGPLRLAYVGFPMGLTIRGRCLTHGEIESITSARLPFRVDAVRIPLSPFATGCVTEGVDGDIEPETAIVNLQEWSALTTPSKSARDPIRKAVALGLTTRVDDESDWSFINETYRATVSRRGSVVRYSPTYFEEVCRFTASSSHGSTIVVLHEGEPVGFAIVARHGAHAFYIHGGLVWEKRHLRASDLAVRDAIVWAKSSGCDVFNFLRSPADQPGLIRFKEKWGGETRDHVVVDQTITRLGGRVIAALRRLSKHG